MGVGGWVGGGGGGMEEKNEEKGQEDRVYNTNTSIF